MMNLQKTFLPYFFGNKKGMSFDFLRDKYHQEIVLFSKQELKLPDQLLFHLIQGHLSEFVSDLLSKQTQLTQFEIYHLFNFQHYFSEKLQKKMHLHFNEKEQFYKKASQAPILSSEEVNDLFKVKTGTTTIYALLNQDRSRPGIMLIKNEYGKFLEKKGRVWNRPILGESSRGLPFQYSNGRTPLGIYRTQSVMPNADYFEEFGRFRRVKLEFLKNQEESKAFLPLNHHRLHWWKQSHVAADLGRSLLRIHGSGRLNKNPFSSHFPLVSSSGCLTLSELNLPFCKIFHQQDFLNAHLWGQGLDQSYENELKIHGLLYVVETSGKYQTLEII
jgi:hypothetical protein